jgi:squalene-hopene/tetraprenyl-beta-curcumene cyclase
VCAFLVLVALAAEPVVNEPLHRAELDEPFAKQFSAVAAARSLDESAADWRRVHGCVQCHAYLMYLPARSVLERFLPLPPDARELHEQIAANRQHHQRTRYAKVKTAGPQPVGSAAVVVAFGLAIHDSQGGGSVGDRGLSDSTRAALDWMLAVQKDAGDWYVVTDRPADLFGAYTQTMLAAIAIAAAPDDYANSDTAKTALDRIRKFTKSNAPQTPYQIGMLLWAAAEVDGVADAAMIESGEKLLRELQRDDGGWSITRLLAHDAKQKFGSFAADRPSDAYGTGFAAFALRKAGVSADDPQLTKAVTWLRSNQRASGRWFLESLVGRPANVVSNSATAWAVMALDACEALE